VVTHGDAFTGTNLELPLRGHDLGVDTRDVDARVEAGTVMSLDEITGEDLAGASTAVIGTLRARETTLGPAEGVAIDVEESVLLLETEPGDVLLGLLHDLSGMVTEVGPVGGTVVVVGLSEDKDVVATTERILEDSGRTEVDIGVMSGGLVGGRAIEVPDPELTDVCHLLADSRGLGTQATVTINPDVFSLDLVALGEGEVGSEEIVAVQEGH